jgi:hypothetical protein
VLKYVLLYVAVLTARGDEEVAKSQFFNRSALDPRPNFQLELEASAKNGEIQVIVGMRSHSSQLVQLMQVQNEAVTHHLVDGLVVTKRTVVAGYYTRIRTQGNFFIE